MRVSVIISNRNDTAMLAVTVRSILEELKAVPSGGEVVICDNSDRQQWDWIRSGEFVAKRYFHDKQVRLYRQEEPCLFTARETAIEQAKGEYIMCLDSHMLVGHNTIIDLVNFMNRHKDDEKVAFAHAPISWVHQHEMHAKHDRDVAKHELGPWGAAYDHDQRITWKGMPWMCRKNFWKKIGGYGALAEHHVAWGGGDMHIGVKPWLLGYENWAVPCSPCIHIGPFSQRARQEYTYRVYSQSGRHTTSIGFLISCYILGGEEMMKRNAPVVKEKFKLDIEGNWEKAKKLGQREKDWLDTNKVMSFQEWLERKPWNAH